MKKSVTLLTILPAAALLLAACGSKVVVTPAPAPAAFVNPPGASPVVLASVPPMPPVPAETMSASPGQNYIWVSGHYDWMGDHYAWVKGAWMAAPNAGATWVVGHWEPVTGGYTWVGGHWQ